jgi:hypothetical protein
LRRLHPRRNEAIDEPEIAQRANAVGHRPFWRPAIDVTIRDVLRKARALRYEGGLRQRCG